MDCIIILLFSTAADSTAKANTPVSSGPRKPWKDHLAGRIFPPKTGTFMFDFAVPLVIVLLYTLKRAISLVNF